ncbi:MAG: tetratricopeptide repeat-containing sulfotransferase family protein [Planctomycetota bacterium]|jgi:tetratricopeptide (TPR) repeat protein
MTDQTIQDLLNQADRAAGNVNHPEAIRLAQEVLRREPRNVHAIGRLGGALKMLGKHHKAKAVFEQAIRLEAISPSIIGDYAGLLNQEGQHDKALEMIERAAREYPGHHGILSVHIEILATTSRYEEAYELMRPVIESNKYDYRTIIALVRICRKIDKEDLAIELCMKLGESGTLSPSAKLSLYFQLSTLLHDVGRYRDAYQIAEEANTLRYRNFDPKLHSRSIDLLIERWNPETIERMGSSGLEDETALFIVGMPRSGTTLLEQVLGAHSRVHAMGERPYVTDIVKHLKGAEIPTDVPHMHRVHLLNPFVLKQAGEQYVRFLRYHSETAARVVDKRPDNFLHIGLVATMLPGARFLHTTRSFDDIASSIFLRHFGGPYEWVFKQEHIADYVADYVRLMDHWKSLFADRIVDISYESMTKDFEPTVRRVLEFVGLDWEDACLEFHRSKRVANTASIDQVRQPVYTSAVGSGGRYGELLDPFRNHLAARLADRSHEQPS